MSHPPAVFASPLQNILLVEKMSRPERPFSYRATSLPGHLLHYVLEGRVAQECNGRRCDLQPGSLLWYHEDELVRGELMEAPWIWYSVNFIAPDLPPPPFEARLRYDADEATRRARRAKFERLLAAWTETEQPLRRALRCHGALLDILSDLLAPEQSVAGVGEPSQLWWQIESELRKDLGQGISLDTIQRIGDKSAATIARSCHAAVGQAPMQRIKQVRLSLARGLVQRSALSLGEIAAQVGYARLHEFSRDFKKHFGTSASQERRHMREQGTAVGRSNNGSP